VLRTKHKVITALPLGTAGAKPFGEAAKKTCQVFLQELEEKLSAASSCNGNRGRGRGTGFRI
jgi:hypothetical protein